MTDISLRAKVPALSVRAVAPNCRVCRYSITVKGALFRQVLPKNPRWSFGDNDNMALAWTTASVVCQISPHCLRPQKSPAGCWAFHVSGVRVSPWRASSHGAHCLLWPLYSALWCEFIGFMIFLTLAEWRSNLNQFLQKPNWTHEDNVNGVSRSLAQQAAEPVSLGSGHECVFCRPWCEMCSMSYLPWPWWWASPRSPLYLVTYAQEHWGATVISNSFGSVCLEQEGKRPQWHQCWLSKRRFSTVLETLAKFIGKCLEASFEISYLLAKKKKKSACYWVNVCSSWSY